MSAGRAAVLEMLRSKGLKIVYLYATKRIILDKKKELICIYTEVTGKMSKKFFNKVDMKMALSDLVCKRRLMLEYVKKQGIKLLPLHIVSSPCCQLPLRQKSNQSLVS